MVGITGASGYLVFKANKNKSLSPNILEKYGISTLKGTKPKERSLFYQIPIVVANEPSNKGFVFVNDTLERLVSYSYLISIHNNTNVLKEITSIGGLGGLVPVSAELDIAIDGTIYHDSVSVSDFSNVLRILNVKNKLLTLVLKHGLSSRDYFLALDGKSRSCRIVGDISSLSSRGIIEDLGNGYYVVFYTNGG